MCSTMTIKYRKIILEKITAKLVATCGQQERWVDRKIFKRYLKIQRENVDFYKYLPDEGYL